MSDRTYAWRYLIKGDVKFYAKRRRWMAMARSLAWRIAGWNAETCQDCGRRYDWSNWVASNRLYERVHGNLHGTLCPRCFSRQAEGINLRIMWVPFVEQPGIHGQVMQGVMVPYESRDEPRAYEYPIGHGLLGRTLPNDEE